MDQLNGKLEQVVEALNNVAWSFNGSNIETSSAGNAMKVVATVSCGLLAGGSLYSTLVEGPARMTMMTRNPETATIIWRNSYTKAKPLMSKLAVISTGASVAAFWCSNQRRLDEWLLAGGLIFSVVPLSVLSYSKNKGLFNDDECLDNGSFIEEKLNSWDNLLALKTVISVGAFGFMIYLLGGEK